MNVPKDFRSEVDGFSTKLSKNVIFFVVPTRKMLACTDGRDNKSLRHVNGDRVVFKNVPRQYKLRDKISVEYILSPKTKTSTHDYVGIYPRNWRDLREFVGFEYTITPPCEEPSLFRSIEFICQSPHVTVDLHQDYQFIYVSQTQEVLGKSSFFQFIENHELLLSPESASGYLDNFTQQTVENVNIQLTPDEIAYNECYFGNQISHNNDEAMKQYSATDGASGSLDEASNACFTSQDNACYTSQDNACFTSQDNACFTSQEALLFPLESFTQTVDSEMGYKPKRGRPLVKTRDTGLLELRNQSPQSPPMQQRSYNSYMKHQSAGSAPERPNMLNYHQENSIQVSHQGWSSSKPWQYQSKLGKWNRDCTPNVSISSNGKNDGKWGAIPKQCSKCRAPSDYSYQQQLMQHELAQAHEEVRDLKSEVDRLKHVLELSEAGQAKLRVTAEISKREARYAISFLNNLMYSLVTQYKTKIVNFDNSVMYVTRELVSPGWFVPGGASKTLVCGRPSNVKVVSGRDKELKAIIGRQELKIQDLHAKLCIANKIIERANLLDSNMMLELSENERRESMNSPQLTPHPDGGSPRSISDLESLNSSTFDLAGLGEVLEINDTQPSNTKKLLTVAEVHNPQDLNKHTLSSSNSSEETKGSWAETVAVKTEFYPLETLQFWNHEVILDEAKSSICSKAENSTMPNETNNNNNNNYPTNNMNSEMSLGKGKCSVCEPQVSDDSDIVPFHTTEDLN